ncbi:GtrA family protein [uncultured Limosilactobacillus sp.]|uniref:GtrA family protein n=1 Tax=uncultured Limosilactobacillus sp. TaxID=2837629 RepID=UPI0025D15040|nr:GtrA family protein [uncultured Limosilactobacillus sp.]
MIAQLWDKYKQVVSYLFWGVVTTVVNISVFQWLSSGVHMNYQVANIIAWFLSVLVAYFTNKVWVFNSHYTTVKAFVIEFVAFYFYRGLTLLIDVAFMFVGVTVLQFNSPVEQLVVKTLDNVVVFIANFIFSKFLIFKQQKKFER